MQRLREFDAIAMAVAESILNEAIARGYAEVATAARLPAGVPYTRSLHQLVAGYVSFFAPDCPGHQVNVGEEVVRVWVDAR